MADFGNAALWYISHGHIGYILYDNLDDAVGDACYMMDDGWASPFGIQLASGRIVKDKELDDLVDAYSEQQRAVWKAEDERRAKLPPRPTRKIRSPFVDDIITVDANEPEWLGAPIDD